MRINVRAIAFEVRESNQCNNDLNGDKDAFDNVIHTAQILEEVVLGDVNLDGVVALLDVAPFINLITSGVFQAEADINADGVVDLLDVAPFVELLVG